MFLFLVSLALGMDPHRAIYLTSLPDDFDHSTVVKKFTARAGSTLYHCFVQRNQTNRTSEALQPHMKGILRETYEIVLGGYWHFTFVPFKHVHQWRFDEKDSRTKVDVFLLGKETNETKYEVINGGLAAEWGGGDKCAVTGKPRTTRVELLCDFRETRQGKLQSISEEETCSYLVRFRSLAVCDFPAVTNESLVLVTCAKNLPQLA